MIPRYEKEEIKRIWLEENKTGLWQRVELAVLCVKVYLKQLAKGVYAEIRDALESNPIDLVWWKNREKETHL